MTASLFVETSVRRESNPHPMLIRLGRSTRLRTVTTEVLRNFAWFVKSSGVANCMASTLFSSSWHLRDCPQHGNVAHLSGNVCIKCLSNRSDLTKSTSKVLAKPERQVLTMRVVK